MAFTADELLKLADDIEVREVEIPGRGSVYVRGLTGAEREAWQGSNRQYRPKKDGGFDLVPNLAGSEARLLARALCDENGKRLFTDQDAGKLGKLPASVVERIHKVAMELSGLGEDEEQETLGNSEAAPSGDSSSDLPETSEDAPSPSFSPESPPAS